MKIVLNIIFAFVFFSGQFVFSQNQLILQNTADSSKLKIIPINEKICLDLKPIKMMSMEWYTAMNGYLRSDLKHIELDTGSIVKNIRLYTKLYGINNNEITVSILNEGADIIPKTGRPKSIIQTYKDGVEMRTIKWNQISEIYYDNNIKRSNWGSIISELGFSICFVTLIIPPLVSINYKSGGFDTKKYVSLLGGGFGIGAVFYSISWHIGSKGSFRINQQPDLKKLNKREWKIIDRYPLEL